MPEPSSKHDPSLKNTQPSCDESSHHGRRRRHRRKREKPTSKVAVATVVGLILIAGAGIYFAIGPRVVRKVKSTLGQQQRAEVSGSVVHLTYRTVIIENSSTNDWGYTTVTVNDEYEAHCPDIPKGTQFEIRLKDFRGPAGTFEPTAPKVRRVTVQVAGQGPIIWDRPME